MLSVDLHIPATAAIHRTEPLRTCDLQSNRAHMTENTTMSQPETSSQVPPTPPSSSAATTGGTAGETADTPDRNDAAATPTSTVPPAAPKAKGGRARRGRKNAPRAASGAPPVAAAGNEKLTHLVIDSGAIIKGAGMTLASAAEVCVVLRSPRKICLDFFKAFSVFWWRWVRVESCPWCVALIPPCFKQRAAGAGSYSAATAVGVWSACPPRHTIQSTRFASLNWKGCCYIHGATQTLRPATSTAVAVCCPS